MQRNRWICCVNGTFLRRNYEHYVQCSGDRTVKRNVRWYRVSENRVSTVHFNNVAAHKQTYIHTHTRPQSMAKRQSKKRRKKTVTMWRDWKEMANTNRILTIYPKCIGWKKNAIIEQHFTQSIPFFQHRVFRMVLLYACTPYIWNDFFVWSCSLSLYNVTDKYEYKP